jgi:hypothetical protein
MTIYIDVPDMNDSKSRITLAGEEFYIRFTYAGRQDNWYFSLYNASADLILGMIKIVPLFPLTEYYTDVNLPDGKFGCITDLAHVGRQAFVNGEAKFAFIPNEDLEGWKPYE